MYGKQISLRQVYRQVLRYFDFPLPETFHQYSILYSRSFIFDVSRLCRYVALSVNLTQKIQLREVLEIKRWSQWPSVLTRGSATDRLLGLRVRIPPEVWLAVCFECCVLSGRGPCDGPIPRTEELYPVWCVIVYDTETWRMRRPWPALGCCARYRSTGN